MKKKQMWHYSEIETDDETKELMPGFEIQYVITSDNVEDDTMAASGHCVFPPRSQHFPHIHNTAEEVVYVIKGKVVNGSIGKDGKMTEYECGPGTFTFAKKGEPHWTRNPYDEPAEFIFSYYGTSSLKNSGYVDVKDKYPVPNIIPKKK